MLPLFIPMGTARTCFDAQFAVSAALLVKKKNGAPWYGFRIMTPGAPEITALEEDG